MENQGQSRATEVVAAMAYRIGSISPRGPFDQSSSSGVNHTCSLPNPLTETPTDPIVGDYTFHTLGTIIAGAAAAFAVLSILILMFRHATHLSRPQEQLKILRICLLIPVASIIHFIGQVVPASYFYILPWADMMQAFALSNFFLLLLEFTCPDHAERGPFFSELRVPPRRKNRPTRDGSKWYRLKWIAVFQYPVVQFLVSVATDVTQAPSINIYCQDSNKPYFAHLWLNLVHVISTLTAVIACLRFYKVLKTELAGHKPLSKLFAFKLLVGLNILMNVVFWILNGISSSPLEPDSTMNQADVSVGIPAIVNCLILVPFSVFFHYAYDVGPYIIDRKSIPEHGEPQYLHYQGGFLGIRAFLGMLNPSELLGAIARVFKWRGHRQSTRNNTSNIGRRHDAATSTEARDAGPPHEMSRRDHRRMDKHVASERSRRFDQRRADNAPYGWTTPQDAGYSSGERQQRY